MGEGLRARYQQFGIAFVVEHGRSDEDDVIAAVFDEFGDEIRREWEQFARESVRRNLKSAFRRLEEDDSAVVQTRLDGFDVPKVISVPREGNHVEYVHTLTAVRDDAQAQLFLRERNIVNAVHRRDEWQRTIDRLRPAWAVNDEWTIGECIDFLAGKKP